ncbi:MAG: glycosyltransferase [Patescibacteria group bacterium]|nr:glycosyltransferase [Patescibacteria group bacterium]
MKDLSELNIALAHDSFTQLGGAERVVEALHELFPQAPVFTTVLGRGLRPRYHNWDIRTSWLQVLYNFVPRLQFLLPFIPLAVSSLSLEGYDVILSSSSSWAKNIKVPKGVVHICYCHTPTRFLWVDGDYVDHEAPKILRPLVRPIIGWMRVWDLKGSSGVSQFIANSREVQKRIKSIYHRDSIIIEPFVDTVFWRPTKAKGDYFLLGGRLQAHKKTALIVEIFNELKLPLRVFGVGRQEKYLRSIAGPNISFLGRITDEDLRDEYSAAKGFIYPQLEDFGLMPLEAAACGTATLAYGQGGALETVQPGITGELFSTHDKDQIKRLVLDWQPQKYQQADLIDQAQNFSKEAFQGKIKDYLLKALGETRE